MSEQTFPVDVSKLQAALEKAVSPVPWWQHGEWVSGDDGSTVTHVNRGEDDAALIVAAVNALPAFVALVRAVEALADEWDREAEDWTAAGRENKRQSKATEASRCAARAFQRSDSASALRAAVGAALNPQETGR